GAATARAGRHAALRSQGHATTVSRHASQVSCSGSSHAPCGATQLIERCRTFERRSRRACDHDDVEAGQFRTATAAEPLANPPPYTIAHDRAPDLAARGDPESGRRALLATTYEQDERTGRTASTFLPDLPKLARPPDPRLPGERPGLGDHPRFDGVDG